MKTSFLLVLFFSCSFLMCSVTMPKSPDSATSAASTMTVESISGPLSPASVPDYKKETALRVFNNLKRAIGLRSSDAPSFGLVARLEDFSAAMIDYDTRSILIEEPAYDICQSLDGDSLNALAVFLGHELAHFLSNHEVRNHYVWEFRDNIEDMVFKNIPGKHSKKIKKDVTKALISSLTSEAEREADLDGTFIAYLAGYKTVDIGAQLLEKTYTVFEIPKEDEDYPSFEERKQLVKQSEESLKELIKYFEMGNMLIALKEYDDALPYYLEVAKSFQSREIYNNIGVLYALSFLNQVSETDIKYHFPLELDIRPRSGIRGSKEDLLKMLKIALENFESAINRDHSYPVAYLNKGSVHAMISTFEEDPMLKDEHMILARASAYSARRLSAGDPETWKRTLADAHTLFGVIEALSGDSLTALQQFQKSNSILDNQLANKNIERHLNKQVDETPDDGDTEVTAATIDNMALGQVLQMLNPDTDVLKAMNPSTKYFYKPLAQSNVMLNYKMSQDGKETYEAFHLIHPDYPASNQATNKGGIRLGSKLADISAVFGKDPDYETTLTHGTWAVFRSHNLIFQLDNEEKLTRWAVFQQKL